MVRVLLRRVRVCYRTEYGKSTRRRRCPQSATATAITTLLRTFSQMTPMQSQLTPMQSQLTPMQSQLTPMQSQLTPMQLSLAHSLSLTLAVPSFLLTLAVPSFLRESVNGNLSLTLAVPSFFEQGSSTCPLPCKHLGRQVLTQFTTIFGKVAHEKLLYAINNCQAIDADNTTEGRANAALAVGS